MSCIGGATSLNELTLDGNPMTHELSYKQTVLRRVSQIRQLDMKRVTVCEYVCLSVCLSVCLAVMLSLGLGLGLRPENAGLGLGLGLETSGLGLGLGLETSGPWPWP